MCLEGTESVRVQIIRPQPAVSGFFQPTLKFLPADGYSPRTHLHELLFFSWNALREVQESWFWSPEGTVI